MDAMKIIAATALCAIAAFAAQGADLAPANPANAQQLIREFDLTPDLLSAGKQKSAGDPLQAISKQMTAVHEDLSQLHTDEPVQDKERKVVKSLDEMIAALERQQKTGTGRGNKPNGGRKESVIAKGDPAFGDLHGVDPNARQWAQLPPKLRNEILQSKTEGFPPGYESLLQSYYQQLSEEKSVDDKPATAPPPDAKPPESHPATP